MHILTLANRPNDGAFAIEDENGDNVLVIFEEYDDAQRYLYMLEELEYPEMEVTEVEPKNLMIACDEYDYEYVIITKNDLVVPPNYAKISENTI
jgi:hypothetical protein